MAAKVNISVPASTVVDYEVSGGEDGTLDGQSRDFAIGKSGAVISFLTVRRAAGTGPITVRSVSGKLSVEQDGGKGKGVRSGKSLTVKAGVKRVLVKEAV